MAGYLSWYGRSCCLETYIEDQPSRSLEASISCSERNRIPCVSRTVNMLRAAAMMFYLITERTVARGHLADLDAVNQRPIKHSNVQAQQAGKGLRPSKRLSVNGIRNASILYPI